MPARAAAAGTRRALDHGLLDLGRLESMVLRAIGGDYFRLPTGDNIAPITLDEEKPCDPKSTQENEPPPIRAKPRLGSSSSRLSKEPTGCDWPHSTGMSRISGRKNSSMDPSNC